MAQNQNVGQVMQGQIGHAVEKECVTCGSKFMTANPNEEECLSCKITRDMKLPKDTIVNQNVLNIYLAGRYDREKGIDSTYLKIAEGVALLDRKHDGEQLCTRIKFIGEKKNEEIEDYVNMVLKDAKYKKKYDAFVFVKVSSHSNFMVFAISWSDRTFTKLLKKDKLFIKNYAISIAINWYYGDRK